MESFNGKFRDECLNQHWFTSLTDARLAIEAWRRDYNRVRPHSSLGQLPPAAEAFARTLDGGHELGGAAGRVRGQVGDRLGLLQRFVQRLAARQAMALAPTRRSVMSTVADPSPAMSMTMSTSWASASWPASVTVTRGNPSRSTMAS